MHSIRGAVAAALAVLCVAAPVAFAHEGNPNYRSEVSAIAPALPGLEARVLNYDDAIELAYDGERPLVVEGYRDEPYLRFHPDERGGAGGAGACGGADRCGGWPWGGRILRGRGRAELRAARRERPGRVRHQ